MLFFHSTEMSKRTYAISTKSRPAKKRRTYAISVAPPNARQRVGYGSVARTRGAQVSGEMKYFDTERVATAIAACTTTWVAGTILDPVTFNTLCVPVVGAAINQRIGREIKVLKIKLRGHIIIGAQSAQNVADNASHFRMMLVQDMQTNAAQMTSAQLMTDQAAGETTINSFQNLNNFGRFRVLKDKIFSIGNANLAGSPTTGDLVQSGIKRPFKMNVKFAKFPCRVRFNATNGGTVADIIDNSFHFIIGTDNTALTPNVTYTCRVCYKE